MNLKKGTKITLFVFLLSLFVAPSLFVLADEDYGTGAFTTPELFEENMFTPAFDMWINQSVVPTREHITKYGIESVQQGNVLRHLFFVPESVQLDELKVLDKSLEVITPEHTFMKTDTDDSGYYGFSSSDTDLKLEFDQSELGAETNTLDVDETSLDDATVPTSANYTHPDSVPITGVAYVAGDGKSITEYAREQAEADGGVLYDIANATFIGFSFDDYENLVSVNVAFDEEFVSGSVAGEGQAGVLQRIRTWLHNRKMKRQAGGILGVSSTIQNSAFRPIANAGSQLPAIVSNAKQFISKQIGAGFFSKIFSVNSLGSGALKTAFGWIIGALGLIIGIAVLVFIVKKAKKRS